MPTAPSVQFLGAAGCVTGSKHLVTANGHRVLLDCGLFQGLKRLRLRNWDRLPVKPSTIDAVVLSHAHIDHVGFLPRLVRKGFRGPVFCTAATADLLDIMLPDSGFLQEEEAERANRHGYSKHTPALPLYTRQDAVESLKLVQARPYDRPFEPADGMAVTYRPAGHILGSASIDLAIDAPGAVRRLVFSGDLGRWGRPIIFDPMPVPAADHLLIEATYGDRAHVPGAADELARIVTEGAERGGAILVPAFALGRTQELLWRIREMEDEGRIPALPVYVDSPMAIDVTALFLRHEEEHDAEMHREVVSGQRPLCPQQFTVTPSPRESKALNDLRGPIIIISASGMATGGRILHHLKRRLPEKRTTVVLVGYQAAGTRGRALQDGAAQLRMHGLDVPVRARVERVDGLSAHADRSELLRWMGGFERPPGRTHIVHAEPDAAAAFRERAGAELGWRIDVAEDAQTVEVGR